MSRIKNDRSGDMIILDEGHLFVHVLVPKKVRVKVGSLDCLVVVILNLRLRSKAEGWAMRGSLGEA